MSRCTRKQPWLSDLEGSVALWSRGSVEKMFGVLFESEVIGLDKAGRVVLI